MHGGRDAGQFARVATCEFGADDNGVLRDADEKVRVHVNSCHSAQVVVDDERDGRAVCDGGESGIEDFVGAHSSAVVAGRHDQGVLGACAGRLVAELDGAPDGLLRGAGDDGNVGETCVSESHASLADDGLTLGAEEMDGFAVGDHGDQAGEASFCEADSVGASGSRVEIFGVRIEGQGGGVDSWTVRGSRGHFCNLKITVTMIQRVCWTY